MSQLTHIQRVRLLYKGILRLHRGLPTAMQSIGDNYVKDEFRRHRTASEEHTTIFMQEWTKYYVTLANQLGKESKLRNVGAKLSQQRLEMFTDDQIVQLYELYAEISPAKAE